MGCLKNLFAMVGFVTIVAIASVVGWHYRVEIRDYYDEWQGKSPPPADSLAAFGVPGEETLRAARRTSAAMEMDGGPATVSLDANEMASLIVEGISRDAAEAIDSLRVVLTLDRITLEGRVATEVFARELLGQFATVLDRNEPISVSGPVRVVAAGTLAWEPDALRLRSFPFPGAVIAPMVNALTGGSDGAFLIPIPTTVGDVRVRAGGVTFYRRTD